MLRVKPLLIGAILLTLLAYWPVRQAGFVFEDIEYLKPAQRGLVAEEVLAPRGLTAVSFRLNVLQSGLDARPYHATNLGLHLLVGLSFYAFASRLLGRPRVAVLAAAVYLLHPLQSETVSYLAGGRAELIATLGTLWVVWALSSPVVTWSHGAVALIGCIVAMGGKELGVMALPLAALHACWFRSWSFTWRTACAVTLGVVVFGLLLTVGLHVRVFHNLYLTMTERGPLAYAALQATALWTHLGHVIVPMGLTVDHDVEQVTRLASLGWLALTVSAPLVALWYRRRAPVVTFGVWWVALSLGPRFLIRQSEYLGEHHVTTAFLGVWIALTATVAALSAWAQARAQDDSCDDSLPAAS